MKFDKSKQRPWQARGVKWIQAGFTPSCTECHTSILNAVTLSLKSLSHLP